MKLVISMLLVVLFISCTDNRVESIDHLFVIGDLESGESSVHVVSDTTFKSVSENPLLLDSSLGYVTVGDSIYTQEKQVSCDSIEIKWFHDVRVTVKKGTWLNWDSEYSKFKAVLISSNKILKESYELGRDIVAKLPVVDSITYRINKVCAPLSEAKVLLKKRYGNSGEYLIVRAVTNDLQATDTLSLDTMFDFNRNQHTIDLYKKLQDLGTVTDKGEWYETLRMPIHVTNQKDLSSSQIVNLITRRKAIWTETTTFTENGKERVITRECGESVPFLSSTGEVWASEPYGCNSYKYNMKTEWSWSGSDVWKNYPKD